MVRDSGGNHPRAARQRLAGAQWSVVLMLLLASVAVSRTSGEEPAEAFLDALRDNGYHDAALLYLDRIDGSPLIPPSLQAELSYQRGVTLVQAATLVRDSRSREQMLNEAKLSLEQFLAEQPDSPRRLFARRQFILLLHQWAKMKMDAAERTGDADLRREAASLYDDAFTASVEAVEELKTVLSGMNRDYDPLSQRDEIEYRDSLRGEYLLTLLRAAESLEKRADTEADGSPARQELLERAIKRYAEMYSKYSDKLAGLQARLYQARCLTKLGKRDDALKLINDDLLSITSDHPVSRQLKTQALLLAIECWMDESKRDYANIISQGTAWLETIRPAERDEEDWVRLRLLLARAHTRYADQTAQKDPRDDIVRTSRDEARKLARMVARRPGPYQEEGRMLLAEIPGGVAAAKVGERQEAQNFEEARQRATEAIAEMQSAEYFLEKVPERLEDETNDAVRKELQNKLETAADTVTRKRQEARENLQLAMQFADANTLVEDLNLVRRLLAYLYYMDGEYYDSAVLGEFTARRFPGSSGARQSAKIALAAYLKLYETNPSESKDFEINHVVSLADYIVETWSGTVEAAEAINTLIPFLIRQGKLDAARQYVENIAPETMERGSAELRIGEALWNDYLRGMQELREWEASVRENDENVVPLKAKIAARRPELEAKRNTALEILEAGVARMRKAGVVNATVPRAVNSLAQIYVDTDQAPKAVALLDDPDIGVLPLIERKEPVMDAEGLREASYRVALSALVSALPKVKSTEQRSALIDRSQQMIQLLRKEVGESQESQQRLVEIFLGLARGLELQLQLLDKPADRRVLSEGFRAFLDEVRGEADDVRVLRWVADSYASLGNGLTADAQSAEAARTCFQNAVATYDQILRDAGKYDLGPDQLRTIEFRKALALRDAGDFTPAIDILKRILRDNNGSLEYQKEAARTYQLWAAEPTEGIRYLVAVRGTKPDPETNLPTVWGWSRIAKNVQRDRRYRDDFYEARYNWALCNYKLALRLRKKRDQETYYKKAKDVLVITYRLYPTLGGEKWYEKYNTLLKRIERSMGDPVVGLVQKR
jgi:hypothetical protein